MSAPELIRSDAVETFARLVGRHLSPKKRRLILADLRAQAHRMDPPPLGETVVRMYEHRAPELAQHYRAVGRDVAALASLLERAAA